jgi:hypothetical protein
VSIAPDLLETHRELEQLICTNRAGDALHCMSAAFERHGIGVGLAGCLSPTQLEQARNIDGFVHNLCSNARPSD